MITKDSFLIPCTFPEVVAIVGKTTWEVMNAKKATKDRMGTHFRSHDKKKCIW